MSRLVCGLLEHAPPAMIREMDGRAVIFLHIPKTAGTTLNRIIEWQYNPLAIFTMDPYRIRATPERLQKLLGSDAVGVCEWCAGTCITASTNFSPKAPPISRCCVNRWPGFSRPIILFSAGLFTQCIAR